MGVNAEPADDAAAGSPIRPNAAIVTRRTAQATASGDSTLPRRDPTPDDGRHSCFGPESCLTSPFAGDSDTQ